MKNSGILVFVGIFLAISIYLPPSHALTQNIDETKTLRFPMSIDRADIDSGNQQSFISTVSIDNWESLKAFSLEIINAKGVSNLTVLVDGTECNSMLVGTLTKGHYVCTSQLVSDLTSSSVNITVKNEGYGLSGLDNVTINILEGYFTVDSRSSIDVVTYAEVNATVENSTAFILSNVFSKVWQTVSSFWSGQTGEEFLAGMDENLTAHNGTMTNQHDNLNMTFENSTFNINSTEVWDVVYDSARSNKTQGTLLIDNWKCRFCGPWE